MNIIEVNQAAFFINEKDPTQVSYFLKSGEESDWKSVVLTAHKKGLPTPKTNQILYKLANSDERAYLLTLDNKTETENTKETLSVIKSWNEVEIGDKVYFLECKQSYLLFTEFICTEKQVMSPDSKASFRIYYKDKEGLYDFDDCWFYVPKGQEKELLVEVNDTCIYSPNVEIIAHRLLTHKKEYIDKLLKDYNSIMSKLFS